jgi:hypothetical protein
MTKKCPWFWRVGDGDKVTLALRGFGDVGAAGSVRPTFRALARISLSLRVPGGRAGKDDEIHALPKISCHENFVFRADIGAPINVNVGIAQMLERTVGVEHHDHVVDVVRVAFRNLASGRDVNRVAIRLRAILCLAAKA